MIAILVSIIMAAPGSALKTGGLPPMLLNPDTVVTATAGGLPSTLGGVMDNVVALPGAVFGVGVVDLNSGDRISRNERRRFYIDTPDIVNAAVCVVRHNSGEFPLDSLIARNEQLWQIVRRGQQGAREATQSIVFYMGGIEHITDWLSSSGHTSTRFEGVSLDWEGAPDVAASYTTVGDCLDFIEIVSEGLDITAVRRMTTNPPLSGELEITLGSSNVVYGWVSGRDHTRCINLIVFKP
ncbi:MAG: hypothetical protein KAH54_11305, partial [Candidatus Sabulitectum sp.]|nr:hypothetical protein [Candidatus Sabulitectum sp.]